MTRFEFTLQRASIPPVAAVVERLVRTACVSGCYKNN